MRDGSFTGLFASHFESQSSDTFSGISWWETAAQSAVQARGCGEMGQGIKGVTVATVLGEDQVGPEEAKDLGDDGIEAGDPGFVIRVGLKRHVDGVPDAAVPAPLVDPSGPWEEVAAGLVHRDGQDLGVV